MSLRPDKSACIFGAGKLTNSLQALLQEVDGVRAARDIEHIHRMRVASRRLRSALPLFAGCYPAKKVSAWLKEVRRVTRALGAARDLDVQIDRLERVYNALPRRSYRPGVHRLLVRLKQQRTELQARVLQALDRLLESAAVAEMQKLFLRQQASAPPVSFSRGLYRLAFTSVQQRLDELFSFEAYIHHVECVSELHAMRIAAKRVRYTLETFSNIYPAPIQEILKALRKAQDTLGEIHDCDVWIGFLPTFLEDEQKRAITYYGNAAPAKRLAAGILFLQESRQLERDTLYRSFITDWDEWKKAGLWQSLEHMLRLPLSFQGEVYPPAPALPGETGAATPGEETTGKETDV